MAKRQEMLMALADEVYKPEALSGRVGETPAWQRFTKSGFDASGTRFVVRVNDALWEANIATQSRRRLCGLRHDVPFGYAEWRWLDADHVLGAGSEGIRVYSLAKRGGAAEVFFLPGVEADTVEVLRDGRLLFLAGYDVSSQKEWSKFFVFTGGLRQVGHVPLRLHYAGSVGSQLIFRYSGGLVELTNVDQAIDVASKKRSSTLVAGEVVQPPAMSYDLVASACGTTLSAERDLADYRGLFVERDGRKTDLGEVVLTACAHQRTSTTDGLDITPNGETALVAAGQGRQPRAATLMAIDLGTEQVTSTFEYPDDGFGPILSVHSAGNDHCLVVSENGCTVYECSRPTWSIIHSRKHKGAMDVAGASRGDSTIVAVSTTSRDGVLVLGVTSKRRLKLLGKLGGNVQKITWRGEDLLGLDAATDWRHFLCLDDIVDKLV